MANVYMMIGVPGSGKSTWIANQNWTQDCVIVSTDNLIEAEAARQGKTYNDVFKSYIDTATGIMREQVVDAVIQGRDIIWDQTNTVAKSRKGKLTLVKGYRKIAVVFAVPERAELEQRLALRPGKTIPGHVLDSMIEGFAVPSEEEGFDEVWRAQ
jgi:predicted kinase